MYGQRMNGEHGRSWPELQKCYGLWLGFMILSKLTPVQIPSPAQSRPESENLDQGRWGRYQRNCLGVFPSIWGLHSHLLFLQPHARWKGAEQNSYEHTGSEADKPWPGLSLVTELQLSIQDAECLLRILSLHPHNKPLKDMDFSLWLSSSLRMNILYPYVPRALFPQFFPMVSTSQQMSSSLRAHS